ncbi:CHAD domain-containing protein [Roseomonas gilardii subsp. gilardii]|uniref:CYTH and CHAD domain-containing protein n=1 Tax=Roseomonas gilardii TaxID=257708 RepID=UPI001FFA1A53|nr:CYTH and CHAD domain-containing protein [Roseomonas gilardii]UPG72606.1 CHAD domain-containing protein [Roseomonas gilardii subsp. gilardii]
MTQETNDTARELEIKFLLPDTHEDRLPGLPVFDGIATRTQAQVTTYFDTSGRDLFGAGMALRVRRIGRQRIQTLKTGSDGTAFGRGEWEAGIAGDRPEMAPLAGTPAAGLLPAGAVLEPVFTTEVRRTRGEVAMPEGARIEVALDIGEIRAGEATEAIRELELELKAGTPAALCRLAAEIQLAIPGARLSVESKAERGWLLSTGARRVARKADDVRLSPEMTTAEAMRDILASTLRHLMGNEPVARAGVMEGVHQMRVALRRTRAALRLFEPLLEPHATARFEAELKRLGQVLGHARDWDVFCEETLAEAVKDEAGTDWITLLRPLAEECRAEAHARMIAELQGPALGALVLGLVGWAEEPALLGGEVMAQPVSEHGADLLARLNRKVRRRGKRIAGRSEEELHALRKALKRLRYGLEFLGGLCPEKPLRKYLNGCKDLQEHLGGLNDAVTAIAMGERLAGKGGSEVAPALAALTQWAEARRDAAIAQLPGDWKRFKRLPLPLPG